MNVRPLIHILCLSLWTVCSGAFAEPTTPAPTHSNQPPASDYLKSTGFESQTCPRPDQLQKDENMIWHGPNDWKSYNQSFADEIGEFLGAQWLGINVGKVICIYSAKNKTTFPITLERNAIVPSPVGGMWGPDQGGHKDCHASMPADCPFVIEAPKKPATDVYEDINFYQQKPSPPNATP